MRFGIVQMVFARWIQIQVGGERRRRYWADAHDFADGPDTIARVRPHDVVTFDPMPMAHGWRAKNVRLVADDALITTASLAPEATG
jgi:hypothetical protein